MANDRRQKCRKEMPEVTHFVGGEPGRNFFAAVDEAEVVASRERVQQPEKEVGGHPEARNDFRMDPPPRLFKMMKSNELSNT